jgi:protein TonB
MAPRTNELSGCAGTSVESAMTSVRLPVSFLLSTFTTAVLFWFLGVLVASDPRGDLIPMIRDIQIAPALIPEPPEPIREPIRPPPPKPPHPNENFGLIRETRSVIPGPDSWALPKGVKFGEDELGPTPRDTASIPHTSGSNRGPVPQVRIEPDYPPQARDRGIEGWVKFSYTVASDGSVKDVVILDAQPTRIWDSATIRAVSSWKYQPAVRDGRPVEQAGLVAVYRFELD